MLAEGVLRGLRLFVAGVRALPHRSAGHTWPQWANTGEHVGEVIAVPGLASHP
jgi:hypothetical protein